MNKFMTHAISRVKSLSSWFIKVGFTSSVLQTSPLTMKLLTLMFTSAISHTLTNMQKMVRASNFLLCLFNENSFFLIVSGLPAEHFAPLLEQIARLDDALYNIQFEQHWLEAQTDRQAISAFLFSP